MPKFTRKPIPVDAVQFRKDADLKDWPEGVEPDTHGNGFMEDDVFVSDGDWVITLPNGVTALCRDEDFQKKYDKV